MSYVPKQNDTDIPDNEAKKIVWGIIRDVYIQRSLTASIVRAETLKEVEKYKAPSDCSQEDGSVAYRVGDIVITAKAFEALKAQMPEGK